MALRDYNTAPRSVTHWLCLFWKYHVFFFYCCSLGINNLLLSYVKVTQQKKWGAESFVLLDQSFFFFLHSAIITLPHLTSLCVFSCFREITVLLYASDASFLRSQIRHLRDNWHLAQNSWGGSIYSSSHMALRVMLFIRYRRWVWCIIVFSLVNSSNVTKIWWQVCKNDQLHNYFVIFLQSPHSQNFKTPKHLNTLFVCHRNSFKFSA